MGTTNIIVIVISATGGLAGVVALLALFRSRGQDRDDAVRRDTKQEDDIKTLKSAVMDPDRGLIRMTSDILNCQSDQRLICKENIVGFNLRLSRCEQELCRINDAYLHAGVRAIHGKEDDRG